MRTAAAHSFASAGECLTCRSLSGRPGTGASCARSLDAWQSPIETEHILLAISRQTGSVAMRILAELDAELPRTEKKSDPTESSPQRFATRSSATSPTSRIRDSASELID